jgi:hypothetical protein
MTYGSKPIQSCVTLAVQYAYRIKKNTTIACAVYGNIERDKEPWYAAIYDVTALVQLDEIIHTLAEQEIKNPKETLDFILTL